MVVCFLCIYIYIIFHVFAGDSESTKDSGVNKHLKVLYSDLLLFADSGDTQNDCLSYCLLRECRAANPKSDVGRREDLKTLRIQELCVGEMEQRRAP